MAEREFVRGAGAVLLIPILAAALGLRLTGLDRLLPHMPEPDAYMVEQARMLEDGLDEAERSSRAWGKYPHLLAHILHLLPRGEPLDKPLDESTLAQHLERASAPLLAGRRLSALLSALGVALTWTLGRRFLGPWGGLLAAALLSSALLHLSFSQQARPHAPLSSAILLSLLCSLELVRRGARPGVWLAAGGAAALAVATLHSGVAVLLPLGVAFLLRGGERRRRDWLGWIPAAALVAGAVALFYPFLFLPAGESAAVATERGIRQSGHEVQLSWFDGGGFRVIWETLVSYDPLLLIGCALGVLLFCLRALRGAGPDDVERRRELWVCLAFALPYLLVVGLFRKSFDRFLLPVYPLLCCCAAFGALQLASLISARRRGALAAALGLALLAFPTWIAVRFVSLHLAEDTPTRALRFLEENVDRSSERVLVESRLCLPALFRPRLSIGERGREIMYRIPWEDYLFATPPEPEAAGVWELVALWNRGDLLALPVDPRLNPPRMDSTPTMMRMVSRLEGDWAVVIQTGGEPPGRALEQALNRLGRSAARISAQDPPGRGTTQEGYGHENMVRRVLRSRCWGPDIEVFRLKDR